MSVCQLKEKEEDGKEKLIAQALTSNVRVGTQQDMLKLRELLVPLFYSFFRFLGFCVGHRRCHILCIDVHHRFTEGVRKIVE